MKDALRKIYDLAQLDFERDRVRAKGDDIPRLREELTREVAKLRSQVEEAKKEIAGREAQRRDLEGEVALGDERMRDFQAKLNQIKTNKEYQAGLKEISEMKKEKKEREDRILQLMTELETLKKSEAEGEEKLKQEEERISAEAEKLKAQEEGVASELAGFDEKRRGMMEGVDPEILVQYEKVKQYRSDAVVFVTGGTCQGCYTRVPPQLVIEIRKFRVIHTCPSCHRILYFEEPAKEESA